MGEKAASLTFSENYKKVTTKLRGLVQLLTEKHNWDNLRFSFLT